MSISAASVVQIAESQESKPYLFGSPQMQDGDTKYGYRVAASNQNPPGLDCSGLFMWTLAQLGYQWKTRPTATWLFQNSTPMSVETALKTPGALLFLEKGGGVYHVEISRGDGSVVGARSGAGIVTKSWSGIANSEMKENGSLQKAAWFPDVQMTSAYKPTKAATTAEQEQEEGYEYYEVEDDVESEEDYQGWPGWAYALAAGGATLVGYGIYKIVTSRRSV